MVLLAVTAFVVAPVVVWAASQTDWPVGKGATSTIVLRSSHN
jgi:hypothetical protein